MPARHRGQNRHPRELAGVSLTVLDNDANRMQRVEQNLERMKNDR